MNFSRKRRLRSQPEERTKQKTDIDEKEDKAKEDWTSLQTDCGLSPLDVMFLQDQSYKEAMRLSLRASVETFECEEHKRLARKELHETVIPSLPISFEQLCCVIVRGISRRCGSCLIKQRKLCLSLGGDFASECDDPLFDFCPHLICSEWKHLQHLRTISVAFWQAFLETRVGRAIRFCFPRCRSCSWADMYMGASLKIHQLTDVELCLCSSKSAAVALDRWAKRFMGDGESRIVVAPCRCRKPFE